MGSNMFMTEKIVINGQESSEKIEKIVFLLQNVVIEKIVTAKI